MHVFNAAGPDVHVHASKASHLACTGLTLWLEVDGAGDLMDCIASVFFGIKPEPHFQCPPQVCSVHVTMFFQCLPVTFCKCLIGLTHASGNLISRVWCKYWKLSWLTFHSSARTVQATSLAELWARRWNLTVSSLLRDLVRRTC